MSDHRVLLIENPAQLSIDLGRLRIRREGFQDVHVLPSDIAVLCLHHHAIRLSVHALCALAEAGASVVVTDASHHPCAMLLPAWNNGSLVRRLRRQIWLDGAPEKTVLWQRIVQVRLRTQAANLRALGRKGSLRLERLAEQVLPGDSGKCEGQGARHYWSRLFPAGFRREKRGAADPVNARLNFGYAVLRAAIARALAQAGLNPALGLGHDNLENPFNLADDFIEPYRFAVERHVVQLDEWGEFDSGARKNVLRFMGMEIVMGKSSYRLPSAIAETVASFVRFLEAPKTHLLLPEDAAAASGERQWA
jgi:CRISPR-associated protein Cas1